MLTIVKAQPGNPVRFLALPVIPQWFTAAK